VFNNTSRDKQPRVVAVLENDANRPLREQHPIRRHDHGLSELRPESASRKDEAKTRHGVEDGGHANPTRSQGAAKHRFDRDVMNDAWVDAPIQLAQRPCQAKRLHRVVRCTMNIQLVEREPVFPDQLNILDGIRRCRDMD